MMLLKTLELLQIYTYTMESRTRPSASAALWENAH